MSHRWDPVCQSSLPGATLSKHGCEVYVNFISHVFLIKDKKVCLFHRHRDLRTEITVSKSRTMFITSEMSSFVMLIGRTKFFHW